MLDELGQRYIGEYEIVKLTANETMFLKCILDNWKHKCATYNQIISYIWGCYKGEIEEKRKLFTLVERLKPKIKSEFKIKAINGVGYLIK